MSSAALMLDTSVTRTAELMDTLESELELIEMLNAQLLLQRVAVVRADAAGVDEAVHASGRVLVTLEEARRRRRQLCTLIFGDAGVSPGDILVQLGSRAPVELVDLVGRITIMAETVARTIAVNRRVLQGAIRSGDELIRVMQGAPAGGLVYERSARVAGSAAGTMLNRKI